MLESLESPSVDLVSRVLAHVRVVSGRYTRADLTAPFGVRFEARPSAMFHAIDSGAGVLTVDGAGPPILLRSGDAVLLPRGDAHTLCDTAERRARVVDFEDGKRFIESPSRPDHARTRFVCAEVTVDALTRRSLLAPLPRALVVASDAGASETLGLVLHALAHEAGLRVAGEGEVMRRLIELAVLTTLRAWLLDPGATSLGWLRGLRDPVVARALAAMHARPGDPVTLASLARKSATSRATLARRFAAAVGETPLAYLANLRMEHAARALENDPGQSLETIARAHGYRSVAAFSRSFKRWSGQSPGALRRGG